MKALIIFTLLFCSTQLFAHRGEFVSIENVVTQESNGNVVFKFDLENIKYKELRDLTIHFVLNDEMIDAIEIPAIHSEVKFTALEFVISSKKLKLTHDKIQIEIVKLFGNKDDWGGWDNPVAAKQVNTLFSEFYADAPWRMKKTDAAGNIIGIPVHCFLHDADLDPIQDVKVDNINIQIKNAIDPSFGPVLTYDTLSTVDFQALFSCPSPDDSDLDIREFDFNSFTPTSSQTFDFDIDTDVFDDFLAVSEKYWYFTFTIPPSDLIGMNDIVDILVTIEYANLTFTDDKIGLRVFRTDDDIPTITDFYRGDTHLHSMYTQSQAEIGLPLCSTKEAAILVGQDWITTTDHTSDYDNYGVSIQANWQRIHDESIALNSSDSSMIYISGLEVALNNNDSKLVHMLAYPNPSQPLTMPYIGDGNGDLIGTSVSIDNALDSMSTFGGFAYMAHPFATGDELPTIPVNGGIWNVGESSFPDNSGTFPLDGGVIICNDTSITSDVLSDQPGMFIKEGIKGGQIWNSRYNLIASGDELDAWDVQANTSPFAQMDTTSDEFHFRRFRQGQEIVNHINRVGLQKINADASATNWKLYYAAGTDAHGSFNNSNTDDFAGAGKITNNAVGKLSTVAYCPDGMGENGENVLSALHEGTTTMSDGPIITIGISSDGPNANNEVLMGENAILGSLSPASIFLNMEYVTSNEFGDVTDIKLFLGTEAGEIALPISFTTVNGSASLSFQLNVLLESIFGAGNIPQNEYMYVRAELTSEVDYTGYEFEYKTDYDIFHSITNPIWIRYENNASTNAFTSSIAYSYPNPVEDKIHFIFKDNSNFEISIYDQAGRIVKRAKGHGTSKTMNVAKLKAGVYNANLLIDSKLQKVQFVKL